VASLSIRSYPVTVTAPRRPSFVDLTDHLEEAVDRAGITEGSVTVYCTHTTCGVLINEWEDGALQDLLCRLEALVPTGAYYAHDDFGRRTQSLHPNEPINGRAHVAQMLLGATSVTIPVAGGVSLLGRWQRLLFLELDGPKPRTLVFQLSGVGSLTPSA
jgi:secondary thiamine-phosphate synthase enzyme